MNTSKRIKRELDRYRLKYDLYEKALCSQKENQEYKDLLKHGKRLPEDVYPIDSYWSILKDGGNSEFYRLVRPELTQEEITEYLMYKKLDMLKTIKNCLVFFTVIMFILLVLLFASIIL